MAEDLLPQTHKRAPTVDHMRDVLQRTARNIVAEQARRVAICWQTQADPRVTQDAHDLDALELLLLRMKPHWKEHMDLIARGPRRSWP